MEYNKVNWEAGEVSREGYVSIDGIQYQTVQPEYTGNTPINPDNLNHMDDQIELISNYISNRYKSLWTGTWASGSLTVTDSSKYNSFIVTVGNVPVVCYKTSAGRVSGVGASAPGTTARYDRLFAASTSGDVWTIEWLKELVHNANGNHGAFGTSTITEIVGLDPIVE